MLKLTRRLKRVITKKKAHQHYIGDDMLFITKTRIIILFMNTTWNSLGSPSSFLFIDSLHLFYEDMFTRFLNAINADFEL